MRLRRDERGQAIILVALAMTVLLGFAALALDVGSWFHAQRQLQGSVDAGALAAAQDLPLVTGVSDSGAAAQATAGVFVSANVASNPDSRSGTVSVTYPAPTGAGCTLDNCIAVSGSQPTNGLLASVLNAVFSSVHVSAHAQAYVAPPGFLKSVSAAPLDTSNLQANCPSLFQNPPTPCDLTIQFDFSGDNNNNEVPLLDLSTHSATDQTITASSVPTPTLVTSGFPGELPVNQWYAVIGGAHNEFEQALQDYVGNVMLMPVFDQQYPDPPPSSGPTSYHVIGFVAFKLTNVVDSGRTEHLMATYSKGPSRCPTSPPDCLAGRVQEPTSERSSSA